MPNNPFDEALEYFAKVAQGLETGVVRAMAATPLLIRNQFQSLVSQKLNTSSSEYMSALNIELKNGIIVVELDPKNFLANSVEDGATAFDLHKMLQTSQKVRIGKNGFRWLTIPMEKTKSKTMTPSTIAGQNFDERIRAALSGKPQWSIPYTSMGQDGAITSIETLVTKDKEVAGLSRIKRFKSSQDAIQGRSSGGSQFVLFRRMSENPLSKSFGRWKHPGIEARRLFPSVQTWADVTLVQIIEKIIVDSVAQQIGK